MRSQRFLGLLALLLGLLVPLACGSKDDDGPPPTIGDATNLERPAEAVPTTAAP
jgi:hypothetical protein